MICGEIMRTFWTHQTQQAQEFGKLQYYVVVLN